MLRVIFLLVFAVAVASCESTENPAKVSQSISYLTDQCESNDANACHQLGGYYAAGTLIYRDYEKALVLSTKACKLKHSEACHNAGLLYSGEYGIPKDVESATYYYEKACSGEIAISCNAAAALYILREDRSSEDINKAGILYGKSCRIGDEDGCDGKRLFDDYSAATDGSEVERAEYYKKKL